MAFRFLLVTIVAGMGLQPPSRDEVSTYVQRSRTWIAARLDDWSVTNARRAQEAKDRAFRDIVDKMSRDFSQDLARMDAEKAKPKTLLAFEPIMIPDEFEQIAVPDQTEPDIVARLIAQSEHRDDRIEVADSGRLDFALDLNREFDGLTPRTEPAPAPPAAEIVKAEPTRKEPVAEIAKSEPSTTDRGNRVSSAVDLTRQAFIAWASVFAGGRSSGSVVIR